MESSSQNVSEVSEELIEESTSENSGAIAKNIEQLSPSTTDLQDKGSPGSGFDSDIENDGSSVSEDVGTSEKEEEDGEEETQEKTYHLIGYVVDKDTGEPINDFEVHGVENWNYHPEQENMFEIFKTVSVKPGQDPSLVFTVSSSDFEFDGEWAGRLNEEQTTVTVSLSDGIKITGRVLYHDGEPAAGVDIRSDFVEQYTAQSDSSGRFELRHKYQEDKLSLSIKTEQFSHDFLHRVHLPRVSELDVGDIILPKTGSLKVIVQDSEGNPMNDIWVTSSTRIDTQFGVSRHSTFIIGPKGMTNENGVVLFDGLMIPAEYQLNVNNHVRQEIELDNDYEEFVIVLSNTTVKGRVTINGEIPGMVRATLIDSENQRVGSDFSSKHLGRHPDFDGSYEITNIPEGQYKIQLDAESDTGEVNGDNFRLEYEVSVSEDQVVVQDHDFQAASLVVKVIDQNENIVQGAEIRTSRFTRSEHGGETTFSNIDWSYSRAVFEDGRILLNQLIPGNHYVTVQFEGVRKKTVEVLDLKPGNENDPIEIQIEVIDGASTVVKLIDVETGNPVTNIEPYRLRLYQVGEGQTSYTGISSKFEKIGSPGQYRISNIPESLYFISFTRDDLGWTPSFMHTATKKYPYGDIFRVTKEEESESDFYVTRKSILEVEYFPYNEPLYPNPNVTESLIYVKENGDFQTITPQATFDDMIRYTLLEPGQYFITIYNHDEVFFFEEIQIMPGEIKKIEATN